MINNPARATNVVAFHSIMQLNPPRNMAENER